MCAAMWGSVGKHLRFVEMIYASCSRQVAGEDLGLVTHTTQHLTLTTDCCIVRAA